MASVAVNTLPFWSAFVLSAEARYAAAVGPLRTIFNAGAVRRVFAYKQGDAGVQALEGEDGTERDTILVDATKTRGGAQYSIKGISLTPDGLPYTMGRADPTNGQTHRMTWPAVVPGAPGSQPLPTPEDMSGLTAFMVNLLMANFRLDLKVDGSKRTIELGPATLYNAVGGLQGRLAHSVGQPFALNYYEIPEGITWQPSGSADSNMVVALISDRNVVIPQFVSADGIDPNTGLPYIAEEQPSSLGQKWRQKWIVNFHGQEISPVSDVS